MLQYACVCAHACQKCSICVVWACSSPGVVLMNAAVPRGLFRRLAKLQELQGYNDMTQEALEACVDAHVARYGRVGAETLARLVDAREHRELPSARASQQAALSTGSA